MLRTSSKSSARNGIKHEIKYRKAENNIDKYSKF